MSDKVSGWDVWSRNFYNARKFFVSKGNTKTRSRLKDKWYKDFVKDLNALNKIDWKKVREVIRRCGPYKSKIDEGKLKEAIDLSISRTPENDDWYTLHAVRNRKVSTLQAIKDLAKALIQRKSEWIG